MYFYFTLSHVRKYGIVKYSFTRMYSNRIKKVLRNFGGSVSFEVPELEKVVFTTCLYVRSRPDFLQFRLQYIKN